MSVSKAKRTRVRPDRPAAAHDSDAGANVLPPTVSRLELLDGESQDRFRTLVAGLLTVSARMHLMRDHLGKRLGISGPQFGLLMGIAHLQSPHGISAGALAQALHLSNAFVAAETGKLARRNLLIKRINPLDRRVVLLSLSPAGSLRLERTVGEIRAINDLFFGTLDRDAFAALCHAVSALVDGSGRAIRMIASSKGVPQSILRHTG